MAAKNVSELIREILSPILKEMDLELYDVEFVKEGPERYLRVFLDREGTVTLKDCEAVSRLLSKELDAADPIKEQYFLEVSSPGAERVLKTDLHFKRFKGQPVAVKLNSLWDGSKLYKGKLLTKTNDEVQIETTDGVVSIPLTQVQSVKTILE